MRNDESPRWEWESKGKLSRHTWAQEDSSPVVEDAFRYLVGCSSLAHPEMKTLHTAKKTPYHAASIQYTCTRTVFYGRNHTPVINQHVGLDNIYAHRGWLVLHGVCGTILFSPVTKRLLYRSFITGCASQGLRGGKHGGDRAWNGGCFLHTRGA